eukprot:6908457-Ditylum_brightwellii.AAC.1
MLTRSSISSSKKSTLVYRKESRRPSPEKHWGKYNTVHLMECFQEHTNCVMDRTHSLKMQGGGTNNRQQVFSVARPLHSWKSKVQGLPQSWEFSK